MSDSTPPSSLPFPHPVLTPIVGRPTNSTLQLLKQQVYANARAIHSTRGGGANGHLALVMPAATYLARTNVAFDPPVHPGDAPVHNAAATTAQITETNRRFAYDLAEHSRYLMVQEELKKQIFQAVDRLYLQALADPLFGFADVSCAALLDHLDTEYGVITREEIDANRLRLSAEWNPDDPIESLWQRLTEAQRYATAANEPLTIGAVIRLTLAILEQTGVFISACERWRERDDAEWTLANFKLHFNKANKERMRRLTAQAAGYHGAHTARSDSPATDAIRQHDNDAAANSANAARRTPSPDRRAPPASAVVARTPDNLALYYCWTHGIGKNRNHTSATCQHKADGHQDDATFTDMMGGNDRMQRVRRDDRSPRGRDTRGRTPGRRSSSS